MTNRREREIKDTIEKVGLRMLDMDQSGPHIKVKVGHPLLRDHIRTFVYGRSPRGDVRRDKNEEAELLRWKRSITEPANHHVEGPMESAWKKAGLSPSANLPPPILHPEPRGRVHVVAKAAMDVVRPVQPRTPGREESIEEWEQRQIRLGNLPVHIDYELSCGRDPRLIPKLAEYIGVHPDWNKEITEKFGPKTEPTTPQPAKEPIVAKEPPTMDTTTNELTRAEKASAARKGIKPNILSRPQEIKLIDWLRKPGLLQSTNSILLAEAATKELGFPVTHSNVLGLLKDMGLEIKNPTRRDFRNGQHVTRHDYMAQVLVAIIEQTGGTVPDVLMKLAIGERNDLRFAEAPMPSWPRQG